MSLMYTLFLYFIAIRFFARNSERKTYVIISSIVTAIVVLTDIGNIISLGIIWYLKNIGWQVGLAYLIFLGYLFISKSAFRRRSFERKKKRKTKETIQTAKSRGLFLFILGIVMGIVGGVFFFIDYEFPLIAYIGSFASFVVLVIFGIIMMAKTDEVFVFIIWTDKEAIVFSHKIKNKFSFNYMNYIREINKYYIIEKKAVIYYNGDYGEIHYVWMLKTENMNNFDVSQINMERNAYSYQDLINMLWDNKKGVYRVTVINNKVEKVIKR